MFSRNYTPRLLAVFLAVLSLAPTIILAHIIEINAGHKECFFEDLHVHDKVYRTTMDMSTSETK
jgi:p24 family protein beta-1